MIPFCDSWIQKILAAEHEARGKELREFVNPTAEAKICKIPAMATLTNKNSCSLEVSAQIPAVCPNHPL